MEDRDERTGGLTATWLSSIEKDLALAAGVWVGKEWGLPVFFMSVFLSRVGMLISVFTLSI